MFHLVWKVNKFMHVEKRTVHFYDKWYTDALQVGYFLLSQESLF